MQDIIDRLNTGLAERYRVESELGQGGMAVVFLAQDLRHHRPVAIKVLRPEVGQEVGAERFLHEIQMAAGLTHPHILPVYASGEAGGLLYYVMPSMKGNSLRDRLDREKQLPLADAIRIATEVAGALDYAHRHQVVHRDIKPENILIHDGSALVADFGIGKALSAQNGPVTQTGMSLGTPAYMSPEQASGESDIDGRSDVYSLGCVLFEMLCGEPPFTGPTAQAVIAKRFLSPVPPVRAMREVPPHIEAAVARSLARNAVDRFATAADLAAALRAPAAPTVSGPTAAAGAPRSVAVLPLANMSADPENEYFSDGITEEIINALAKLPGVQVASRTSSFAFKGKEIDIRKAGEKLGVATLLEGSVRKIGNRIRLTAQLVDVSNGYQIWSEKYDRQLEDVFAVQEEISRAIVDALKVKLAGQGDRLVVPATQNMEAYTLYLKGRFFLHKFTEGSIERAQDFFKQALALDHRYARAYAGIADCWADMADDWYRPDTAYPQAKTAAAKALELEPNLAEAHTSIGKVLCWYEWDFEAAEKSLRHAVALNPNSAEGQFVLGSCLPCVGQLDDAIAAMRKALTLDPLSGHFSRWLGRFLLYGGAYDACIIQSRKTIEVDPGHFQVYLDVGAATLALGDAEEALKWYRRGLSLETSVRSYDAMLVRPLAALDRMDEAWPILERLEAASRDGYVRAEILAMGYGAAGELDKAFDCLDRALTARSAGLIYLHLDPGYEPLRGDPRFAELVRKVGVR